MMDKHPIHGGGHGRGEGRKLPIGICFRLQKPEMRGTRFWRDGQPGSYADFT